MSDVQGARSAAKTFGPVGDPPVKLETMLFSLVQPHEGHEVAYNDWYERDHQFSGAMVATGYFSNRRWVAPRRLKALRFPSERPVITPLDSGSLLSIYWREEGCAEAAGRWARDQWHWLNERGRIFTHRTNVHSTEYRLLSTLRAERERVPIELALQHPFAGLATLIVQPKDETKPVDVASLEQCALSSGLMETAALLSTWALETMPAAADEKPVTSGANAPPSGLLQLAFLRTDPEAVWDEFAAYASRIGQIEGLRVGFAAGYVPTIPGTTAYLDEI